MTFPIIDTEADLPPSIAPDGGPFGPRGPRGDRGPPGSAGPPGPAGAAGSTGALVLISKQLVSSPVGTIAFNAIPGTYTHLKLIGRGRMSTSGSNNFHIYLQLNGDSGANYDWFCAADASSNYGDTGALICDFPLSTNQALLPLPVSLEFPYYTDTVWNKVWLGTAANQFGLSAGDIQAGITYGQWHSNMAITDILLLPGGTGGMFDAPTLFSLYGVI